MAKTDPNERAGKAFTGFIVDGDSPGITRGRKVLEEDKFMVWVAFPFLIFSLEGMEHGPESI